MLPVPAEKSAALIRHHGEAGRHWLAGHENRLEETARRWKLAIGPIVPGGQYCNFVYRCERAGAPCILKIGFPEPELFTEMATLQRWRGRSGCVQLMDLHESTGAMLLEAVLPGTTFREKPLASRQREKLQVFSQIPTPLATTDDFPSWQDWFCKASVVTPH